VHAAALAAAGATAHATSSAATSATNATKCVRAERDATESEPVMSFEPPCLGPCRGAFSRDLELAEYLAGCTRGQSNVCLVR
jgi:hypothetical protein